MRQYYSGARGQAADNVSENNKIVFIALGGLFGVALVLFIMHIVCVKCMLKRFGNPAMGPDDGEGSEAMRRRFQFGGSRDEDTANSHLGLDKALVDLLPTFVYTKDAPTSPVKDVEDCAVCLAEFEEQDRGRILPNCNHCFHVDCIDMWFLSHSSCPLCRREVLSPSSFWAFAQLPRSRSCPESYAIHLERMQLQLQNSATGFSPATAESIFRVFNDSNIFAEHEQDARTSSRSSRSGSSFEISGLTTGTSAAVTDETQCAATNVDGPTTSSAVDHNGEGESSATSIAVSDEEVCPPRTEAQAPPPSEVASSSS